MQSKSGSIIRLRDEGGTFLEVPPEKEGGQSDAGDSLREEEGHESEEAGEGEEEGRDDAITTHVVGGAREVAAGPGARSGAREEELAKLEDE